MSVRPILEGARDWVPPADTLGLFGKCHFAIRAEERGVQSLPGHLLQWVVMEALDRARTDLVAPVKPLTDTEALHRIILPEGLFYPVVRDGRPVTIYDQAQKRKIDRAQKLRKRNTGSRVRRVPGGVAGCEW